MCQRYRDRDGNASQGASTSCGSPRSRVNRASSVDDAAPETRRRHSYTIGRNRFYLVATTLACLAYFDTEKIARATEIGYLPSELSSRGRGWFMLPAPRGVPSHFRSPPPITLPPRRVADGTDRCRRSRPDDPRLGIAFSLPIRQSSCLAASTSWPSCDVARGSTSAPTDRCSLRHRQTAAALCHLAIL
jgi:hypothetical protein